MELEEKYRKLLEAELRGERVLSYSEVYKKFKQEQQPKSHIIFEKVTSFAGKILPISISESEAKKIKRDLDAAHIDVPPYALYSLATLVCLSIIFAVIGLAAIFHFNLLILLVGLLVGAVSFLVILQIPHQFYLSWRAKASNQLVLAVLYMVIYMEHTPNLEKAVWFAAKHLPPPLSLDFIKILWDVETKKYSTIGESIEAYAELWRGYENAFIDAIHLIESSLVRRSKKEQSEALHKAQKVILDGVQDRMMSFAHSLQAPVQVVHMLGIVLPLMSLTMLPMVTAFLGGQIKAWWLFLFYNVILPLFVFATAKSVLDLRPAGINPSDIYRELERKYSKPTIILFGKKIKIFPWFPSLLLAVLIIGPASGMLYQIIRQSENIQVSLSSFTSLVLSTLIIVGIGLSLALYYWLKSSHLMKIRKKIKTIEEQFASAIFQLGNRVAEGIPLERAFGHVAATMPKSDIAGLFELVDFNIRQRGMTLKEALFDPKAGALVQYPSAIIKSVMTVVLESARKSPQIVAKTLITVSQYLEEVHRVEERLKDLLADTISSLNMQALGLAPVICGIVTALSALTVSIMLNLASQMAAIQIGGAALPAAAGTLKSLLEVFQISYMLPSSLFQVLIGVYVLELAFILNLMLTRIVHGIDPIMEEMRLAKTLTISSSVYSITALLTSAMFISLAGSISKVT